MCRHLYLLTTLALLLPAALTGCARTEPATSPEMQRDAAERTGIPGDMIAETSPSNTLVENARAIAELRTFVAAVEAAGLVDELNAGGPYTVFAPTDEAFDIQDADELLGGSLNDGDRAELAEILRSHIVEGEISFDELEEGQTVVALTGDDYAVARQTANQLRKRISDADIIAYDIESSNGVIHVINLVLNDEGFFRQQ